MFSDEQYKELAAVSKELVGPSQREGVRVGLITKEFKPILSPSQLGSACLAGLSRIKGRKGIDQRNPSELEYILLNSNIERLNNQEGKERSLRFLSWLINDSVWSDIFLDKDLTRIESRNSFVIDPSCSSYLMIAGMQNTRIAWRESVITHTWCELCDLGLTGGEAFFLLATIPIQYNPKEDCFVLITSTFALGVLGYNSGVCLSDYNARGLNAKSFFSRITNKEGITNKREGDYKTLLSYDRVTDRMASETYSSRSLIDDLHCLLPTRNKLLATLKVDKPIRVRPEVEIKEIKRDFDKIWSDRFYTLVVEGDNKVKDSKGKILAPFGSFIDHTKLVDNLNLLFKEAN